MTDLAEVMAAPVTEEADGNGIKQVIVDSIKADVEGAITNIKGDDIDPNIITAIKREGSHELTSELVKETHRSVRRYLNWNHITKIGLAIVSYFKVRAYLMAPEAIAKMFELIATLGAG